MPQKLRSTLALRRIAATWISCNPSHHGILQASKSCMKQPVDFHQLAVHMRGIFLPWIAFCRECKHALMVLTKPWSNTELRWKQRSTWKWITWRSRTNQWSVWISRPVQWRCLDGHGWSMISMQLCSLWQRITASCHPDLESDNDWRVAPSAFSSQSHGPQVYRSVEKTHHRLQQIEVDIGAQLRPGQWIVALKIIWFVSGISKVIQSIKLVFAEYFAHIKCDLKSAESGRICECCFWETLDTKDQQIWWNSGGLSFDACTSPACSPFTVSDRSFMGRTTEQRIP